MKALVIEVHKREGRLILPLFDTFKITNDRIRKYVASFEIPLGVKRGAKVDYIFIADYVSGKGIDYSTALTLKPKAVFPNGIYR